MPPISQGTSVTLTALVAPAKAGRPAPTGTVQFDSAVSAQGSETPIGGPATVTNGQAQLVTTSIPAGTQLVVANYSGELPNYSASNASTAEVVTGAATIAVSASPTTVQLLSPAPTDRR